jgi:hypothetical protein
MMIDLEKAWSLASKMAKGTRSNYHLTLGQLIKRLEKMPKKQLILTSAGAGVQGFNSYRGYYEDLALAPAPGPIWTASQLLKASKRVIDTELIGYKGGEFLMTKDTPLWFAGYGNLGEAVMDLTPDGVLVTRNLEETED